MSMDVDDFDDRARAFLAELRRISLKHRVMIGGCGCLGSPWLGGITKKKLKTGKSRYAIDPDFTNLKWE
jgi:hypothetical protein